MVATSACYRCLSPGFNEGCPSRATRHGEEMNYGCIAFATVGGMVAYFVAGFVIFILVPQMINVVA